MEAKDTVVKCDTSMTCCLDCHQTQSEISFKAGIITGTVEGKYDGRKEVVEWLIQNSWDGSLQHWGSGNYNVQCIAREDYLAKLKEWGIE